MKFLLIEDDARTAAYIVRRMNEVRHEIDHASTGEQGLSLAHSEAYDVLIIDRMLPGLDGLTIVKTLRKAGIKTAVLFLTALDETDDRVEGLNAGGDDYLVKPFEFSELLARVNALSRRPPLSSAPTVLRTADLEMDLLKRTVIRDGETIDMPPREFMVLEYLLRHAGHVVTRTMLLENVWEYHFDPKTNIVETHISRLRSKLDRGHQSELIQTVRGSGYRLRASSEIS